MLRSASTTHRFPSDRWRGNPMAQPQDAELTAAGLPPPPATAQQSRTNRNLWMAFVEEAKANRVYIAYGKRAVEEGHPEIAEAVWEVSGAEAAHALGHHGD